MGAAEAVQGRGQGGLAPPTAIGRGIRPLGDCGFRVPGGQGVRLLGGHGVR